MQETDFNFKRVADPVHGSIGLSKLEVDVIGTAAFQRLRGVKQLGLAHLVFPGADYSRFSHSLGVCHVTGRILDALRRNGAEEAITGEAIQRYRLAALLHDIGHYPFSHTMEDAGLQFYSDCKLDKDGIKALPKFWRHESVGKHVVQEEPELVHLLSQAWGEPAAITTIFTREKPQEFGNLVSSDLDADRIDYLLRTAHHTGLPYGSVDLDYLLSQMRLDDKGLVCLPLKAMRAAEHFLLCRYFDYQQVSYHKTVAGFERVLVSVISELLRREVINCSQEDIHNMIKYGGWNRFDDADLLGYVRDISADPDPVVAAQACAVLERHPPRLVLEEEQIVTREDGGTRLKDRKKLVRGQLGTWADEFKVDRQLWYEWERDQTITKIGSHVSVSHLARADADDEEALQQAIRIQTGDGGQSKPVMEVRNSLMSVLSNHELQTYRLYVLLAPEHRGRATEIRQKIEQYLA